MKQVQWWGGPKDGEKFVMPASEQIMHVEDREHFFDVPVTGGKVRWDQRVQVS
jgi:hypothetical protein